MQLGEPGYPAQYAFAGGSPVSSYLEGPAVGEQQVLCTACICANSSPGKTTHADIGLAYYNKQNL